MHEEPDDAHNPRAGEASVREFREHLARRLAEAQSGIGVASRLGLMIGGQRWLVALEDAGEIASVPPVTPVPLTQPWFRGLAGVRGNLVTIIDLSMFAGGEPTPVDREGRNVSFGPTLGCNAALLATRLLGLRSVDGMRPAASNADAPAWVGPGFAGEDGNEWRELALRALARDERFLHAGL
jgi:twitching motility protein PilI